MRLSIKRKIDLAKYGDDYKDAYLEFYGISVSEAEDLQKKAETNPLKTIVDALEDHFAGGKFPDEKGELKDVKKEDISSLDSEIAVDVFEKLSGGKQDPLEDEK